MAVNTKEIKTRIKSVKNTKKITRAMQMIAAVKMRKAVEAAVAMRIYATLASELLGNLGGQGLTHPMMKEKKQGKELIIIVTSNRGLCGSYNASVLKAAFKRIENAEEKPIVIAIGKKAANFARKHGLELQAVYEKLSENFGFEDVLPITNEITRQFKDDEVRKVEVLYTNYVSGLVQEVALKQVLPVTPERISEVIQDITDTAENAGVKTDDIQERYVNDEYEFEPGKQALLNYVIPLLVEVQVYHAVLESVASEHSSRMLAMKNATEAAGEMIDDLTLEFNKGRQAAITQEIAEITSGANALAQA